MAVDPNIKKKADDIRNKIYGKEVRESLASGLEAISSDVVENKGRQSSVESRQDSVESQLQDVIENTTDKDVISAPEIIAARNGEPNLKSRLDKEKQEVTAQLADTKSKVVGVPLLPSTQVSVTDNYIGALPITYHDNLLWGFRGDSEIVKSADDGETWSLVSKPPVGYGSVHSIFWTNDGEVLITNGATVLKSVGWTTNPLTVTWVTKITKSMSKGIGVLPWGIDGDGQKFIVTEYSSDDRTESRYLWISTDAGESFTVSIDKYTIDLTGEAHFHGVTYDKWADRFFVSIAHGPIEGVYWSDNDGSTWEKIGGIFNPDAAPTTLTATDNGIVCGSDSGATGLYGIARTANPQDMIIVRTAKWEVPREGVPGFAYRGVRDPGTGQVYVSFKSDFDDVKSVIMAGSATTGTTVWTHDTAKSNNFLYLAVTNNKIIGVMRYSNANKIIKGSKPTVGINKYDGGNINTGVATSTSIGIGRNVNVSTRDDIVIGNDAKISEKQVGTESVVIGKNAVGGSLSIAIGTGAKNLSGYSLSIGKSATTLGEHSIAIGDMATSATGSTFGIAFGYNTQATAPSTIAIGNAAQSIGQGGIAIGASSKAEFNGIALGSGTIAGATNISIGRNSKATHDNSVSLGVGTLSTYNNQIALGGRHMELGVTAFPGSALADKVRIYLRLNATTSKYELCATIGDLTTVLATGR